MNYYNENDPFAAQWLRSLIRDGLIPSGDVDDRDIREHTPGGLAVAAMTVPDNLA